MPTNPTIDRAAARLGKALRAADITTPDRYQALQAQALLAAALADGYTADGYLNERGMLAAARHLEAAVRLTSRRDLSDLKRPVNADLLVMYRNQQAGARRARARLARLPKRGGSPDTQLRRYIARWGLKHYEEGQDLALSAAAMRLEMGW